MKKKVLLRNWLNRNYRRQLNIGRSEDDFQSVQVNIFFYDWFCVCVYFISLTLNYVDAITIYSRDFQFSNICIYTIYRQIPKNCLEEKAWPCNLAAECVWRENIFVMGIEVGQMVFSQVFPQIESKRIVLFLLLDAVERRKAEHLTDLRSLRKLSMENDA